MKKNVNLYYARNTIGLVYILALAKKYKNINKKILVVNTAKDGCNKEFLNNLNDYLKKNFFEVHFINFYKNVFIFGQNFKNIMIRSKNIKNIFNHSIFKKILKYKYKNAYVGGDDFEVALYHHLKYKINFHFVEHGWGNVLNFLKKPSRLTKLIFLILKVLGWRKFFFFYPIKYKTYFGFLSKKLVSEKIYINGYETIISNTIDLKKIYTNLNVNINTRLSYNLKKNINIVTLSELPFSIKISELKKILDYVKSKLNNKKDLIFYKVHPRNKKTNRNHKFILNYFEKNNFKLKNLSNKKNSFLPIEFFIIFLKVKKVFGSLSGYILTSSIIKKDIKYWMPINTFFKYADYRYGPARDIKFKKIIMKKFKNINFF